MRDRPIGEVQELSARSPVTVGRGPEIAQLVGAVGDPRAVVLLEGQAGVGKSRLLEELAADPTISERELLVGHCHPLRDPFPLGPVIEALHEVVDRVSRTSPNPILGALRRLLPDVADRLPPEPPHLDDPAAARHQVFRAIANVLEHAGSPVLVLEDMHWADQATCDLLSFLTPDWPADLGCVISFRPEDLSEGSPLRALMGHLAAAGRSTRLRLEPMDPDSVKELIAVFLGTKAVSTEFAIHIHERTGGIPFAVEETLRLLHDRQDVARRRGRWVRKALAELKVPTAINDAVIARLDHLDTSARRITEAAAIIAEAADALLLSRVASIAEEEAFDSLLSVVSSNLLRETADDRYDFHHDLARQAVYESIPLPLRQQMHLRAAELIQRDHLSAPARLARHYRNARRRVWVSYAEEAADLAISLGHDAGAAGFLQDALTDPDLSLDDRVRMASKLGEAALHGLAHDDAIAVLRDLFKEQLPPEKDAELRLLLARLLHESGDASEAFKQTEQAIPGLTGRPEHLARSMGILANPWVAYATVDDHIHWLNRASEVADRLDDDEMKAIVAVDQITLLVSIGDPAGWGAIQNFLSDENSARQERQRVRMYQNAAAGALWLGHHARARSLVDDGLTLSRRIEYPRLVDALETTSLLLDLAEGRWSRLESRARSLIDESGLAAPSKEGEFVVGSLQLFAGNTDSAELLLTGLVETCERVGLIPVLGAAGAILGRLELSRGDPNQAWSMAEEILDIVSGKGCWVWAADILPVAVEALLAMGDAQEAERLIDRMEKGVVNREAPSADAAIAFARGLVGEREQAAEVAAASYALAEETYLTLPRPMDAALMRARRGFCLLEVTGDGAKMMAEALDVLDGLGARWESARLRRTMRQRGVPTPPQRGYRRRGYGDRLTPREEEVARLAASGLTNRAIADELFLSHRTVAHHLERAMRKVGVSSRTMLAERLRRGQT